MILSTDTISRPDSKTHLPIPTCTYCGKRMALRREFDSSDRDQDYYNYYYSCWECHSRGPRVRAKAHREDGSEITAQERAHDAAHDHRFVKPIQITERLDKMIESVKILIKSSESHGGTGSWDLDVILDELMNIRDGETENLEIERRYLLNSLPLAKWDSISHIWQGYIGKPGPNQLRIREKTTVAEFTTTTRTITSKDGTGLVRREKERPSPFEEFTTLLPEAKKCCIDKIRHNLNLENDLVAEVDIFPKLSREGGALIILEVEIPDPDFKIDLPDHLSEFIEREITGEVEWSNSSLAKNGVPKEKGENNQ
jgi:CYTH domain-containing protein